MDGNGRWAQRRGEGRTSGHRAGSQSVRKIVRLCRRIGIEALTLYAFSFQNWNRPDHEVGALMELLTEFLIEERQSILENGIRLEAIGELDQLPSSVRAVLEALRAESAHNDDMVLTLALSYGGQEEIARAAQALARDVAEGRMAADDIDVDALRSRIPSISAVGEPDLIIRTSGEQRLSNFLLFGSAYAELYFSAQLWPDFGADELFAAVASFQGRERRFGLVLERDAKAATR